MPEMDLDDGLGGNADHCESGHEEIWDAIDLASDQDQATWLTRGGKRVAAIVPVEQAERGLLWQGNRDAVKAAHQVLVKSAQALADVASSIEAWMESAEANPTSDGGDPQEEGR